MIRRGVLVLAALLCGAEALAQSSTYFTEVSEEAGVTKRHRNYQGWVGMAVGTGAAWFDFDRDGDLDLYVPQGLGKNDLYVNQGDGTFIERADSLGAADRGEKGSAVAVADYDNDGWLDLYLANADEDVLLRNITGERFEDVTEQVGLDDLPDARGMSAAWGDYNGDGWLDLYVTNYIHLITGKTDRQDRLLLSQQGERFVDVSHLLGIDNLNGYGFIGGWTDYDADGDADLLLINDCTILPGQSRPTKLFRNDGGTDPAAWSFTEVSAEVGADHCQAGMGLAVGDYDRNGWLDYYYTNIGEETRLLYNQGGTFEDRAEAAGVQAIPTIDDSELWTWGANFFDYDNDGWLDLFVAAGTLNLYDQSKNDPQPNLFFVNNGDGTFADHSVDSGMDSIFRGRSSVVGDYDGDGDLDLFLVNSNERIELYRNDSARGHHWISLDLEGVVSNRDGIGARIRVTDANGVVQYAETRSGSSLGGSDALGAHFGLGTADRVQEVYVRWPSGIEQVIADVAVDQRLRIVEAGALSTAADAPAPTDEMALALYPQPAQDATTVAFTLSVPQPMHLRVYDLLGREVYTEALGGLTRGTHTVPLTTSGWAPGIYMVEVRGAAAQGSYRQALVKQ